MVRLPAESDPSGEEVGVEAAPMGNGVEAAPMGNGSENAGGPDGVPAAGEPFRAPSPALPATSRSQAGAPWKEPLLEASSLLGRLARLRRVPPRDPDAGAEGGLSL